MSSSRSKARRVFSGVLISLLTVAGLAVATPASAAVVTLTINGTVTTADGAPVVGEWIQINSYFGQAVATTDETGAFSIDTFYDSLYPSLTYFLDGATGEVTPALLDGSPVVTFNIVLPPTITTTIQGTVTDAYGVPVASTQMSAEPASGLEILYTDENGFYSMTVEVVQGKELLVYAYGPVLGQGQLSDFIADGITPLNIVVGAGSSNTILLDGVVLAPDGTPAAGTAGSIGTDLYWFDFTTDESGRFSVQIEYGEFSDITVETLASRTSLSAAGLLGLETLSLVIQQLPPRNVTFSGHVTDSGGSVLAHHPVVVETSTYFYTFTDESGFYTIDAVIQPFDPYTIRTEGTNEPYWGTEVSDGDHITVDLVSLGQSYEMGTRLHAFSCDVDGDGTEDDISGYHMLTSGRTDWYVELRGEIYVWRGVTFGQGDIAGVYCADLNGDGASEIIARGEKTNYHPRKGTSTVSHTWWVYDYVTDTVTESTFGKGELDVYFENLDAEPGVELIAVRTDENAADKWWILDDPASPVETFKLGFVMDGTLAFEDVDGVPGVEIVTSITKPNGNVKVEYYTRATGVGSIVKYTVKAKAK